MENSTTEGFVYLDCKNCGETFEQRGVAGITVWKEICDKCREGGETKNETM